MRRPTSSSVAASSARPGISRSSSSFARRTRSLRSALAVVHPVLRLRPGDDPLEVWIRQADAGPISTRLALLATLGPALLLLALPLLPRLLAQPLLQRR